LVEYSQFEPTPPLFGAPSEFRRHLRHRKTKVPGYRMALFMCFCV